MHYYNNYALVKYCGY